MMMMQYYILAVTITTDVYLSYCTVERIEYDQHYDSDYTCYRIAAAATKASHGMQETTFQYFGALNLSLRLQIGTEEICSSSSGC